MRWAKRTALLGSFSVAFCAWGDEGTRGIVPEEVLRARPKSASAASAPKPRYQPATPGALSRPPAASTRQIGVTIWRMRPGTAADQGARILVQEDHQTTTWIPERVSSSSMLRHGDRVRLSIESPEAGYLYVIDRERYTSGERGTPYLIFPTKKARGGENAVTGGRLIEIPAQNDRPNFFTLKASRKDQTEEELTVLLTPKPIPGLEIGLEAIALTEAQVAGWEKQWSQKTQTVELAGGAGQRWTEAEQRAGADATRLLTQSDPAPQTIYRVEAGASAPLLVKVRLRYVRQPSGVR